MANVKINDLSLAGAVGDTMQLETDIGGTTANKVTAAQLKTYCQTGIDHGGLSGISDDDHSQYSLADGTRWTTTPTANRAVISNGSGNLVVSSVTSTELGYLSGVTSAVQTQITANATDITTINGILSSKFDSSSDVDHGGVTGLGDNDHNQYALRDGSNWVSGTASRVAILNASSQLATSSVTTTELGYLSGVTSAIQTQLNSKTISTSSDVDHGSVSGLSDDDHTQYARADGTRWTAAQTASRAVVSNASGHLVVSSVTLSELGHLAGVTSAIQTQLDSKYDTATDVDHDATTNFVANEHIDHTSVSISTGSGLTGGGTIAATRTLSLDVNGLTEDTSPDIAADFVPTYDASATGNKKVKLNTLTQIKETSEKTTNYTLALSDAGFIVLMNGTSLTLTVPPNSSVAFPIGTVVGVYNAASTVVTLTQGSGVTIRNIGTLAQYQECSLRKRGTDEWVAVGNIT